MQTSLVNPAQNPTSQTTSAARLGQILLRKHYVSSPQLEMAIALQKACSLRLGELLIQQGFLHPHQLEEALNEQKWRNQGFWVI
ncbi:MAG: hypothetical protein ACRC6M_04450 [Microcystaceae cyanobacterium]